MWYNNTSVVPINKGNFMRLYMSRSMVTIVANQVLPVTSLPPICAFCGDEVEVIMGITNIDGTHIDDGTPMCEATNG